VSEHLALAGWQIEPGPGIGGSQPVSLAGTAARRDSHVARRSRYAWPQAKPRRGEAAISRPIRNASTSHPSPSRGLWPIPTLGEVLTSA
jgi:hypothetical protein